MRFVVSYILSQNPLSQRLMMKGEERKDGGLRRRVAFVDITNNAAGLRFQCT